MLSITVDGVRDEHPEGQIASNRDCAANFAEMIVAAKAKFNEHYISGIGCHLIAFACSAQAYANEDGAAEIVIRIRAERD